MRAVEILQETLIKENGYKKIKGEKGNIVRNIYYKLIPKELDVEGNYNVKVFTREGTLIFIGYKRIVVGDYGAFIEVGKDQLVGSNIQIKEGQEYRVKDRKYKNSVKYVWLTAKDDSDIKIYYQKKKVVYADYIPEYFYVSPYEIIVKED